MLFRAREPLFVKLFIDAEKAAGVNLTEQFIKLA